MYTLILTTRDNSVSRRCPITHPQSHHLAPFQMDLTFLDSVWGLTAPRRVAVLAQGTNNLVVGIETAAGRYVLRVYGNHADEGRVEVELQILAALAGQNLSFAVPSPVSTRQGAHCARIPTPDGEVL